MNTRENEEAPVIESTTPQQENPQTQEVLAVEEPEESSNTLAEPITIVENHIPEAKKTDDVLIVEREEEAKKKQDEKIKLEAEKEAALEKVTQLEAEKKAAEERVSELEKAQGTIKKISAGFKTQINNLNDVVVKQNKTIQDLSTANLTLKRDFDALSEEDEKAKKTLVEFTKKHYVLTENLVKGIKEKAEKITRLEAEKKAIEENYDERLVFKITELEKTISRLCAEISELREREEIISQQRNEVLYDKEKVERALAAKTQEVEQLQKENAELSNKLSDQANQLAKQEQDTKTWSQNALTFAEKLADLKEEKRNGDKAFNNTKQQLESKIAELQKENLELSKKTSEQEAQLIKQKEEQQKESAALQELESRFTELSNHYTGEVIKHEEAQDQARIQKKTLEWTQAEFSDARQEIEKLHSHLAELKKDQNVVALNQERAKTWAHEATLNKLQKAEKELKETQVALAKEKELSEKHYASLLRKTTDLNVAELNYANLSDNYATLYGKCNRERREQGVQTVESTLATTSTVKPAGPGK